MSDNDCHQLETATQLMKDPSLFDELWSQMSTSNQQPTEFTHKDSNLSQHGDKLHQQVEKLQEEALVCISQSRYSEALLRFEELEGTFEYASRCGHVIKGISLETMLNNQALVYQRLQRPDKAVAYLERFISGIEEEVGSVENRELRISLEEFGRNRRTPSSESYLNDNLYKIRTLFDRKWQLSKCYLRYSGLSSQNQRHKDSYCQAKQSLLAMKELSLMCCQVNSILGDSGHGKAVLGELSRLKEEFGGVEELEDMKEAFAGLVANCFDNNQVYHQSYEILSTEKKKVIQGMNIHSLFDIEAKCMKKEEQKRYSKAKGQQIAPLELCSSYSMHILKILYAMGAYFAIAVELEELNSLQTEENLHKLMVESNGKKRTSKKSRFAEMAFLSSLIMGYRYIPNSTQLKTYLHDYYKQNYQKEAEEGRSLHYEYENHEQENNSQDEMAVSMSIRILKEKYKDYLVTKEMSFNIEEKDNEIMSVSESESQDKIDPKWQVQKKESKKLINLLKPEVIEPPKGKYLNEIAYIDSYEMANSISSKHQSSLMNQKSLHAKSDGRINFTGKKGKAKRDNIKVTRQIMECSAEKEQVEGSALNPARAEMMTLKERGGHRYKNSETKSFQKSKSKSSKFLKSKSREPKSSKKRTTLTQTPIYEVPSDRSAKNIKVKKSQSKNKNLVTFPSQQSKRLGSNGDKKHTMGNSEHVKLTKAYSPMSSVKDNNAVLD